MAGDRSRRPSRPTFPWSSERTRTSRSCSCSGATSRPSPSTRTSW